MNEQNQEIQKRAVNDIIAVALSQRKIEQNISNILDDLDVGNNNLESLNEVFISLLDYCDSYKVPVYFRNQLVALTVSFNFMIKNVQHIAELLHKEVD